MIELNKGFKLLKILLNRKIGTKIRKFQLKIASIQYFIISMPCRMSNGRA